MEEGAGSGVGPAGQSDRERGLSGSVHKLALATGPTAAGLLREGEREQASD